MEWELSALYTGFSTGKVNNGGFFHRFGKEREKVLDKSGKDCANKAF